MAFVLWTEEYSVCDHAIDAQHKHIFKLTNALESAALSGDGDVTIDAVLPHLQRFLAVHFATEERMMETVGYPDRKAHVQQHQECTRQLNELIAKVQEGEMSPVDLAPFIRSWLQGHVFGPDQALADWMTERSRRLTS